MALAWIVPFFAASLTLAVEGAAVAQSPATASEASPSTGNAGLRSGNIAPSGQTVPNPRTLSSAPRSAIDRDIPNKDAGRKDYGICKDC